MLIAGVLTASPAVAFAADDPNVDGPTGLQYSSTLAATPAFAGSVMGPTGGAFANARVELIAWPKGAYLGSMPEGAVVPTTVVAVDRTSSTGRYQLAPASQSLWQYTTLETGAVNFEVVVYADGLQTSQFLEPVENLSNPNARAAAVTTEVGAMTLASTSGVTRETTSHNPNAGEMQPMEVCVTRKMGTLGPRWAVVGEVYILTSNVRADFTYSESASTTLGIGVTTATSGGKWKQQGSVTNDATSQTDFAQTTSSKRFRTSWVWDTFRSSCSGVTNARATRMAGGNANYLVPSSTPTASYCRPYNGGGITKTTGKATTNSTGAELSTAIGIDLSSQAGFTTRASLKISVTGAKRICGTSDFPAANTAGRLVVKAP